MTGEARELFAAFIPDGDVGALRRRSCRDALRDDFTGTMKLLRDADFQELLVNYPRAAAHASSSPTTSRTPSTSEWLIRGGDGQGVQARGLPDGLRRVRAARTPTRSRPSASCSTGRRTGAPTRSARAAAEARASAASASPWSNLQTGPRARATTRRSSTSSRWSSTPPTSSAAAHRRGARRRGRRHGHRGQDVHGRAAAVAGAHPRSTWSQNLSIDRDDFDDVPVFADRGGWGRANRVFDGELDRAARRTERG